MNKMQACRDRTSERARMLRTGRGCHEALNAARGARRPLRLVGAQPLPPFSPSRTAVLAEPEAEAGSEEEEEEATPMTKPSKSKAKKKGTPAAAFALLAEDDEEGAPGSEEEEEEADEPSAAPVVPVVAKVVSIKPHPKADRLRIVKLAAGPALGDVQVVSNAPDLAKHQLVALAVRRWCHGSSLVLGSVLLRRA